MSGLLAAFLSSFIATLLIIRFKHLHERFSADSDLSGPQKFHINAVPRIGGISIAIGLFTIFSKEIFAFFQNTEKAKNMVDQLTESFARLDKEIAFNNQHLDKQAKLQLAAAKASGASETEINQIEQSNLQKRLE